MEDSFYTQKFVKVIDKDGNIVASGRCTHVKPNFALRHNIYYISFDQKWFYGNLNCKFEVVDFVENFIPDEPPSNLTWDYWRNHPRNHILPTVDVYRDFNYDEIDPPIKPYIDEINNISKSFITIESCCGHGKENWQIGIKFYDLSKLSVFLQCLNLFEDKLILKTNYTYVQFEDSISFRLEPNINIDDRDFKLLKKLIKKLSLRFSLA